MNALNKQILERLKVEYGFHAAILYGSRVTGGNKIDSDYDLLLIRDEGERIRKIESGEHCLDLIVDTNAIENRIEEVLYLYQSVILQDDHGFGKRLVEKVKSHLNTPPPALSSERMEQRKIQALGMLVDSREETSLGGYRRHQLLVNLLPHYFSLKQIWFLGDKHALTWLKANDPKTNQLFEVALRPGAMISEVEALLHHVLS